MKTTNTRRIFGMNSVILIAGLVSLLTDLSNQMILPILPLYLTTVLHVQVGTVGLIEGIGESVASVLKWLSGWVVDRYGRSKPLMVAGYGLSNLVKPLFGWSTTWGQVLAIRLADRLGKGIRTTARDTLLADATTPEERGKAFGFRRSMDALGAALGPLVAVGILSWSGGNYHTVFLASAIPGILAVLLLVFFLQEKNPVRRPATGQRAWPKITFKGMNPQFVGFTLISTLFSIGNFSDAFLVLRAQDVGMAVALIPLAYLTFNLTSSLFSVPMGILSDRFGRKPVLIAGYLIFAAIYLGFGLVTSTAWIWVLFILYGLYYAATDGIQKAYIADLVPDGQRGVALGTYNALTGFAALPASLLAGLLWQHFGPLAAFGGSSLLAVTAAVWLLFLNRAGS
jgi:MFS family permease